MSRNGSLLGLSVILLTGVGLALAAFGPATFLYPPPGADITGTASLWSQSAIGPAFGLFALVIAAAGLSIAVGAAVRARGSHWLGWIGCIALAVGAGITLSGMSTVVTPAAAATTIPDSVGIGVSTSRPQCWRACSPPSSGWPHVRKSAVQPGRDGAGLSIV